MDYLKPADFRKIKAFFKALNEGRFKVNTNINTATVLLDGVPTPVNKTECLNLLRSFPELRGEEFKNDNFLIKYLQDPSKRKHLLGKLTPQQQIELTQVFEEKPVATRAVSEQPMEQEQPPVEESPATMAEGGGFPTVAGGGTTTSAPRRIIHIVPHAPEPETTTSSSSQATVKTTTTPAPSVKPGSATVTSSKEFTPIGPTSVSSTTSSSGSTNIETKTQIHAPKTLATAVPPVDAVSKEATQPAKGIKSGGSRFQAPKMPAGLAGTGKNFFSSAGRFFKTNFGKFLTPQLLARGATTVIGGFLGKAIAGNPGMLAGAGLGAIAPDALKSGWLGNKLGSIGNGALNFFPNLSNNALRSKLAKIPKPSGSFLKGGRAAALGLGIFFFMVFGIALFGGSSSGGAAPVTPAPSPPGAITTNISSCTFYRGGDSVPGLTFQNPALPSLISDISTKVGVPPAIIAGILRVETGAAFTFGPDYLINDYDAHSSGVAYGSMQFTKPTFTDYFNSNRAELQSLFNKTDVTVNIDLQSNMAPVNVLRIYSVKDSLIAAAFKVKQDKQTINGSGPWDETAVRKIADRYYGTDALGTTNYAGWDGSPQNYGDDLWKSFTKCQTAAGEVPPADPDPVKLRLAIINEFGVNFDTTFSHDYLKWAWEKFWHAKNTKFIELLTDSGKKEIIVTRNDEDINRQLGCRTVQMRGKNSAGIPYPEPLFKVVLIHELSHIIEQGNCTPTALSKKSQLQSVINQEGYITRYSANTNICVGGTSELNEDYAEMISYFLNQDLPEQALGIHPACDPDPSKPVKNPYQDGGKPLHKQLATEILGVTVPTPTPTPSQTLIASCPITNGNIICPSYGKIASGEVIEDPTCVVSPRANADERDVAGHCGPLYREKYPDLCTDNNPENIYINSDGNLRRTAKSIDIVNQLTVPGQAVLLPTIKGQILRWYYKGAVSAGGDYGFIRLFESEPTSDGIWSLHYTHVNSNDPILPVGAERRSGQVAATLIKQTDIFEGDDATHLHFTIGLNVGDSTSNLKNYSPGWKFPDRELGMCR